MLKRFIFSALFLLAGGVAIYVGLGVRGDESGGTKWLVVVAGGLGILVGLMQLFVAVKKKPAT
jgi:hypothetical protein